MPGRSPTRASEAATRSATSAFDSSGWVSVSGSPTVVRMGRRGLSEL